MPHLKPRTCLAIVLAAGEGKRMQSDKPKVLHGFAGRSMLAHVLASLSDAGANAVSVVVGPGREDVATEARATAPEAAIAVQTERLGTAHAVLAARESLARGYDDVLVVFADTPLILGATFRKMRAALADGAAVAALGFEAADPTGYGRFLTGPDGALTGIREHRDASEAQRAIRLCNAGLMALDGRQALGLLEAVGNANDQKEYYLTDVVEIAVSRGLKAVPVIAPETEVMGVNDRAQLAAAGAVAQQRLREAAMRGGATLFDPASTYFSHDTKIGRDVIVEPHVFFGVGVEVKDGATIHAFSHLEDCVVGEQASIGPYARLRPGTNLGRKARVGNFVELKNAQVGAGAKVNHLSYIGDARIGAEANIGAGTITCNYDGFIKSMTIVGAGAFVGSNSSLVAPVEIGAGAYVGSGSVVTENVEPDALAVARGRQANKPGWAKAFRDRRAAEKAARGKS